MRRMWPASLILLICVAGCGGSGDFLVKVVFPTQAAMQETSQLYLAALVPGPDARCSALLDGSGVPGREGYELEVELLIDLADPGANTILPDVGSGPRLFYAEAWDAESKRLGRGCTPVEGGSGDQPVEILLVWQEPGCQTDADGDGYVSDQCAGGDDCDDGSFEVNPGAFEGPQGSPDCLDGIDNDCDGDVDGADTGCQPCQGDGDCDDGNVCNGQERCTGSLCQEGTALNCDDGDPCTLDGCQPQTGCHYQNAPDGGECGSRFCGDGNWMQQTCLDGQCNDSAVLQECDDGNVCTTDSCDPAGGCSSVDNLEICDDGDPCSGHDICVDGNCQAGPVDKDTDGDSYVDAQCAGGDDCDDDDSQVNPGMFEGSLGDPICTDLVDNDCDGNTDADDPGCQSCETDADCSDNNLCNGIETCVAEACQPGVSLDCDDLEECTSDSCDPATGCVNQALIDGSECGVRSCDGLLWTKRVCLSGQCAGSQVAQDCDDDEACTSDACDSETGCQNTPQVDGTGCGDNYCIGVNWMERTCLSGTCIDQIEQNCNDGNACTADSCDAAAGCDNVAELDGTVCAARTCEDLMWTEHTCQAGLCGQSAPVEDCDDGQDCTVDSCDPANGCASSPAPDGSECGVRSCAGLIWSMPVCETGLCQGSQVLADCDDQDECTTDACNNLAGCQNTPIPDGQPCDDGQYCTEGDSCAGGVCSGDLRDCSMVADDCNSGACSEVLQSCEPQPLGSGTPCDDGLFCSWPDACDGAGSCAGQGSACGGLPCDEELEICLTADARRAFTQVVAGVVHSCGLTADGQVWCWGDDQFGQLGNGDAGGSHRATPVVTDHIVDEHAFVLITAGYYYTCGLTAGGKAYCWGIGGGQLGTGSSDSSPVPAPVDTSVMAGDTTFVHLSAGESHTCALAADGQAWCWGDDFRGQLGISQGYDDNYRPEEPVYTDNQPELNSFVKIAAGEDFTCGISEAGKAFCWGYDNYGQVGSGYCSSNEYEQPRAVSTDLITGDTTFVEIAAGDQHACGLTGDGQAYCWGYNYYGQIGNNGDAFTDVCEPTAVDASMLATGEKFASISAGFRSACGLTSAGRPFCWGSDVRGQLGNGPASGTRVPSPVELSALVGDRAFVQVGGFGDFSWDFPPDGDYSSHACGLTASGVGYCWGADLYGGLGDDELLADSQVPVVVDSSPVLVELAFTRVAAGGEHSCGLMSDGQAFCWGDNTVGQLGIGDSTPGVEFPTAVETIGMTGEKSFVDLTTGMFHSCALTGEGVAWCWGEDLHGQLGDGNPARALEPVEVDLQPLGTGAALIGLVAGGAHTCGLTPSHQAWCWGSDQYGQVGNGGDIGQDFHLPEPVVLGEVIGLGAGAGHTCALTTRGIIQCWGNNTLGELGQGASPPESPAPLPVDAGSVGEVWKQFDVGGFHTCALTVQGKPWCWGWNRDGQLGDGGGSGLAAASPVEVNVNQLPVHNRIFVAVACGYQHTCALNSRGVLYCWGDNGLGQLGQGGGPSSDLPVPVDTLPIGAPIAGLTASAYHTCAVTGSGRAYCWGDNAKGQIGNGSTNQVENIPAPVDLSGL